MTASNDAINVHYPSTAEARHCQAHPSGADREKRILAVRRAAVRPVQRMPAFARGLNTPALG